MTGDVDAYLLYKAAGVSSEEEVAAAEELQVQEEQAE